MLLKLLYKAIRGPLSDLIKKRLLVLPTKDINKISSTINVPSSVIIAVESSLNDTLIERLDRAILGKDS